VIQILLGGNADGVVYAIDNIRAYLALNEGLMKCRLLLLLLSYVLLFFLQLRQFSAVRYFFEFGRAQ